MKTLKQLLEFKAEKKDVSFTKPAPTQPIEADSNTSLTPKSADEKRFKDKHVVQKVDDANGNGDDHFNATNIKAYDRSASNHGYNTGEDQKVYEGAQMKTLKQILGEKHLTPAEQSKREEIAKAMERNNPGMDMGKKMAIATAQAKKVAEEFTEESFAQLDEAARHDQYSTYHKGVKEMLAKIGQHVDSHKKGAMSPTEWNKENGANMSYSHVYHVKSLHRQLQDICDDCHREAEYAQPPKPMKMKEEADTLFNVFSEEIRGDVVAVFEALNEENQQLMIEMIEAEDLDTIAEIVKEVKNA